MDRRPADEADVDITAAAIQVAGIKNDGWILQKLFQADKGQLRLILIVSLIINKGNDREGPELKTPARPFFTTKWIDFGCASSDLRASGWCP